MLHLDDPELDDLLHAHWRGPRLSESMRFIEAVFLVLDAAEEGDIPWPADVDEFVEVVRGAMRRRLD